MPAVLLVLMLALLPGAPGSRHAGPVPNGRLRGGTLSFDGHATAGDFIGTTMTVSGMLRGAPALAGVRGWVEAPVRTLKTGNGRRDRDLNKSMESDKYPTMRFELQGIAPRGGTADSVVATLRGRMTIHGVTRALALPATIAFHGKTARLRSDFPLNLKDYKIGGLSKMLGMLKMHERIGVHVDLTFDLARAS
jgi:polyisoprenoid-binding protein YceI